jgi:hypothetical protein
MGEIADMMTTGIMCSECGVYIEPGDTIYQTDENGEVIKESKQTATGIPLGVPVVCEDCI